MSVQHRWFMMTVVVSFLGTGMGVYFIFRRDFLLELGLGWSVAFIDHCLRSMIDRGQWFRKTFNLFMGGMAVHGLRAAVFLAVLLFVVFKLNVKKEAFLLSAFTAYFIFLVYSITLVYAFPPSEGDTR